MNKIDFETIINRTIETTKGSNRNGGYTCCNLCDEISDYTRRDYNKSHGLRKEYEKTFGFQNIFVSVDEMLSGESNETIKNTRLACLELFKEMMLSTGKYKEIEL